MKQVPRGSAVIAGTSCFGAPHPPTRTSLCLPTIRLFLSTTVWIGKRIRRTSISIDQASWCWHFEVIDSVGASPPWQSSPPSTSLSSAASGAPPVTAERSSIPAQARSALYRTPPLNPVHNPPTPQLGGGFPALGRLPACSSARILSRSFLSSFSVFLAMGGIGACLNQSRSAVSIR
jgi:hypothetical protein